MIASASVATGSVIAGSATSTAFVADNHSVATLAGPFVATLVDRSEARPVVASEAMAIVGRAAAEAVVNSAAATVDHAATAAVAFAAAATVADHMVAVRHTAVVIHAAAAGAIMADVGKLASLKNARPTAI